MLDLITDDLIIDDTLFWEHCQTVCDENMKRAANFFEKIFKDYYMPETPVFNLTISEDKVRVFDTGATRDTDKGKRDYEGFLSPVVLKKYADYLHKHRVQSDGNYRDSDNWQNCFGGRHFDVCMKSACRHFMDWWTQHRGFAGEQDITDSICAVIFNAMAYLYKLELDKQKESKNNETISE